ncbi:MAG: RDD family protein [Gammaproteobacteria bacterium]
MPTPYLPPTPPFEPASLFKRCAALSYDLLLLVGLLACFTLLAVLMHGEAIASGNPWFQFALLAIVTVFFCGFWVHGGQTLGMRAWRIRVVSQDGAPLSWPRAVLRLAAGLLALLPLGLGLWWGFFDAQRRGWHDRLTSTRVVRVPLQTAAISPAQRPQS